jgi:hypothetical protein
MVEDLDLDVELASDASLVCRKLGKRFCKFPRKFFLGGYNGKNSPQQRHLTFN